MITTFGVSGNANLIIIFAHVLRKEKFMKLFEEVQFLFETVQISNL